MSSIRVSKILRLPIVWKLVGLGSSIVGFSCYALSSIFTDLFGEWNPLKIVIYSLVSFLFTGMMLLAKNFGFSKNFLLKAHLGYFILVLTSLYSFFQDKDSSTQGEYESNHHRNRILSLISSAAFALMSMSLSRLFDLGFETGAFNFFLGCIMVSFMKLNLKFAAVGAVFCYLLLYIRSYSDFQQETDGGFDEGEHAVNIQVRDVEEINQSPESGVLLTGSSRKVKKSTITKSAIAHVAKSDIESHRPILQEEEEEEEEEEDIGVKRDCDFLNRYKNRYNLQRLGSI
ncbi:Exocyst subunit exo70 family protein [Quillaja saponaria]|uniref:Exocyst subunit exo70 family protein n=1 Tax=Quillaja saponaria TaxID=32244 RepID=A0AAD7LHR4_QUISA|nr:Exocyst subunit exo70 family protein [Quillaja saponaria]